MKEDSPILYPNPQVGERIGAYAKSNTTSLPPHVIEHYEHILKTMPETANYMVSLSQAQAMVFLTKTFGAKRVLEIGVYVGLSSLMWSHAVGPEGKITGLEFEESWAKKSEETFKKYGVTNIEVIVGDALETLPALTPDEPYDLIFVDAQKSGYPAYLETILNASKPGASNRLLRAGGLIVGDNILRCGLVADDSQDNPWRSHDFGPHRPEYWKSEDIKALRRYNGIVTADSRLENWLCPLWDGVNIARLLD